MSIRSIKIAAPCANLGRASLRRNARRRLLCARRRAARLAGPLAGSPASGVGDSTAPAASPVSPLPAAARADAAANAAVAVAIATLHADRRSALAAGDAAAGLAAVPTRYAGPDGCMARKDEARKAARLVVKEGKAIEAARRAWAIALPEPTFEEAEPAEGPAGKG